jgi:glyoxylase-like metal-dependent hydrolase (beta-lactamase superfamily II)
MPGARGEEKMKTLLITLLMLSVNSVFADNISANMAINLIAKNVYLHTSYKQVEGFGMVASNGLIVVADKQAYIIDTPWSEQDSENLITWLKAQELEPKALVSTHSHQDRTAGIAFFNSVSIDTYASSLTNEFLKKSGKALPKKTFSNESFWLVDDLIEVFYPGGGHTEDNVVVWLPKSNLLFGGCLVRSLEAKSLGYTGEASINTWSDSVAKLQDKYPHDSIVVPGHGQIGNSQMLQHTKDLVVLKTKQQTLNSH